MNSLPFDLGEDLDMLRDTVRNFANNEIAPRAAAIDHDNLFPRRPLEKIWGDGLAGHHRR